MRAVFLSLGIVGVLGAAAQGIPPAQELFLNPFNKLSSHHRPIGAGAEYGVPGGALDWKSPSPKYDAPGAVDSRGRLALVKTFRTGDVPQNRKYLFMVKPSDPERTIVWHKSGGTGRNLPWTGRMPVKSAQAPYPDKSGDRELFLYPRGGASEDIADVFAEFSYATGTARARTSFPLSGTDVRSSATDAGEFGPGAIDWRHPGGFLRGYEVNIANPTPIRHRLNATATRHSRKGASAEQHILSRKTVWPAWSTDLPLLDAADKHKIADNQGDIPYGTVICIRKQDAGLRETLGLTEFGKALFDTFLYYGCCLCDGQGQIVDNAPVLQLRVDYVLGADSAKLSEINDALKTLLPHLYPLRNPRPHNQETEIFPSDGLPYAGGGGPLDPAHSVNTAWDAKR